MTSLLAWLITIGLYTVMLLIIVNLIATATAVKVIRHVEMLEEIANPPKAK